MNFAKTLMAGTALFLAGAMSVHATARLRMTDGVGSGYDVDVTDNGAGDGDPLTVGSISAVGHFGVWTVASSTGTAVPITGFTGSPDLDLSWIAVSSGAGNLTIQFTDTGYSLASAVNMITSLSASLAAVGSTATFSAWFDTENNQFGDGGSVANVNLGSVSLSSPGGFITTGGGPISGSGSVTVELVVHHEGAANSSGNGETKVPEGGSTVAMLGLGLLGLSVFALRRQQTA